MARHHRTTAPSIVYQVRLHLGRAAAGFAIGAANLIPGVSGGTMALLLGLYEQLIEALRILSDREFLRPLARLQVRQALGRLDGPLLLAVGGGAGLALLTLPHALEWMMAALPTRLESFFFGLVVASIMVVSRRVRRWAVLATLAFVGSAAGTGLLISLFPAQHTPEHPLFLFLSTLIAMGAMVLPGVSGAYVLIILGQYPYALAAVTQRDPLRIAVILLGAAVGLLTSARALSWLLRKWHDITLAALAGMILGSLPRVWPWKESLTDEAGYMIRQVGVLPTAWTWDVAVDVALALGALALVVVLDYRRHRARGAPRVRSAWPLADRLPATQSSQQPVAGTSEEGPMRLLIASNNPGKVREYRDILRDLPLELVTPADVGLDMEVEESGATYEENARRKALALARRSGLITLADDSGLEVDALGGEPGLHSHRYSTGSDTDRYRLLLERLQHVPAERRTARFRCLAAIATPEGETFVVEGICPGVILFEPRGTGGFGYDPVFLLPELGKTMAELSPEEKNALSHRGRAGRQARPILCRLLGTEE